jgi:hypothetical protein
VNHPPGHRAHQALLAIGALYVLLALLANEWTVASWLGVDRLAPDARLVIRALGLAGVSWGVLTMAYRRRAFTANANMTLIAAGLLLLAIEGIAHAYPRIFGLNFANGILTKYSTQPGGIYYFDPIVKMNFMLPSYSAEMTYNGHWWHHQTDQYGFRNQGNHATADIVLLGDSQTYGHGLEFEQTIGAALERLTGRAVYNLGRQGDTSLQEAYLLTEHISRLQPRVVLYLFTENDIRDLYFYRTDEELEAFIAAPIDAITFPSPMNVEAALRLRNEENAPRSSLGGIARRFSYLVRLYDSRQFIRRQWAFSDRISDPKHAENNAESIGWRYTRHAISYMNRLAERRHATFVVVPTPAMNKRMISILEDIAAAEKIPFVDTSILDRTAPANAEFFLRRDGHFSASGAEAMAVLIRAFLARNLGLFSGGGS